MKYPRATAIAAADEILAGLVTERVIVAGSLRRGKEEVGDIEIVYIPQLGSGPDPKDLFAHCERNYTDESIQHKMDAGILSMRLNVNNSPTWGPKNKLAVHLASGIPVDLFSTTEKAWWNYLVCRTGSAELNRRICMAAQERGWKWNPYGEGFTDQLGEIRKVLMEEDVFEWVGMKYLQPHERNL